MPDIKARLRKALGNLVEVPAGTARLGKGDGSGTIIDSYSQRTVWYFDSVSSQTPSTAPLAQGLFLQAFNRPELEGTRIRLGYPPYKSNVLHILGFDSGEGMDAVGGITPNEQLVAKVITIDVGSLINLRIAPQSTPDLTVHINPCYYIDSTGALNFFGGDDYDLTSLVGALSSGEHQMVLLALDNISGGLVSFTNTAGTGGQTDKDLFDSTTIVTDMTLDDGSIPLGAVHIYDGQTELTEDDIYRTADPRVVFDATGATSGMTSFDVAGDSGTPAVIGNGDVLTIAGGTGLTSVISGDTLTLNLDTPVSVANGGTGATSLTAHNLIVGNGTSAVNTLAPSTARKVAISDGTDWTSRALVAADLLNSGTGAEFVEYVHFTSASTSPLTLISIISGMIIYRIDLIVTVKAAAGAPTVKIGTTSAGTGFFMDTFESDLLILGTYTVNPNAGTSSPPENLILTIVTDSQTFQGDIYIHYGVPS